MSDLVLKIPHKAAARLAMAIGTAINTAQTPEEQAYFRSLRAQLQEFAATPEPIYAKATVITIDGVPVEPK